MSILMTVGVKPHAVHLEENLRSDDWLPTHFPFGDLQRIIKRDTSVSEDVVNVLGNNNKVE